MGLPTAGLRPQPCLNATAAGGVLTINYNTAGITSTSPTARWPSPRSRSGKRRRASTTPAAWLRTTRSTIVLPTSVTTAVTPSRSPGSAVRPGRPAALNGDTAKTRRRSPRSWPWARPVLQRRDGQRSAGETITATSASAGPNYGWIDELVFSGWRATPRSAIDMTRATYNEAGLPGTVTAALAHQLYQVDTVTASGNVLAGRIEYANLDTVHRSSRPDASRERGSVRAYSRSTNVANAAATYNGVVAVRTQAARRRLPTRSRLPTSPAPSAGTDDQTNDRRRSLLANQLQRDQLGRPDLHRLTVTASSVTNAESTEAIFVNASRHGSTSVQQSDAAVAEQVDTVTAPGRRPTSATSTTRYVRRSTAPPTASQKRSSSPRLPLRHSQCRPRRPQLLRAPGRGCGEANAILHEQRNHLARPELSLGTPFTARTPGYVPSAAARATRHRRQSPPQANQVPWRVSERLHGSLTINGAWARWGHRHGLVRRGQGPKSTLPTPWWHWRHPRQQQALPPIRTWRRDWPPCLPLRPASPWPDRRRSSVGNVVTTTNPVGAGCAETNSFTDLNPTSTPVNNGANAGDTPVVRQQLHQPRRQLHRRGAGGGVLTIGGGGSWSPFVQVSATDFGGYTSGSETINLTVATRQRSQR